MLKNYFLTALRNMIRHKSFSILNIVGLALSMSVCLLIILIILDQYSYDAFHENEDRIHRVLTNDEESDDFFALYASTVFPMATWLEDNYPEVEKAVTINRIFSRGDGRADGKVFSMDLLFVDNDFFSVFGFPLQGINREAALKDPNDIILSSETAEKFFGNEDPLGKVFSIDSVGEYIVSGIVPDEGNKSHIQFDALVSVDSKKGDLTKNWNNIYSSYAYVLLKEGVSPQELDIAFEDIRKERYTDDPERDFSFRLQKLGDIAPGPLLGNEIGFYCCHKLSDHTIAGTEGRQAGPC